MHEEGHRLGGGAYVFLRAQMVAFLVAIKIILAGLPLLTMLDGSVTPTWLRQSIFFFFVFKEGCIFSNFSIIILFIFNSLKNKKSKQFFIKSSTNIIKERFFILQESDIKLVKTNY
jgi:hypothetical protein